MDCIVKGVREESMGSAEVEVWVSGLRTEKKLRVESSGDSRNRKGKEVCRCKGERNGKTLGGERDEVDSESRLL